MADWVTIVAIIVVGLIVFVTALGFIGSIRTQPLTGKCQFPNVVCGWGRMFGVPDFFLSNRNFMFYFLMPLGAIGAIVYGFLDRIRLFRHPVNVTLSVFIALACIPTQVISMLAATMLTLLGTYAVGAFVVVFVVGVIIVSKGTLLGLKAEYAPALRTLDAEIRVVQDQMNKHMNDNKLKAASPTEWTRRMEDLTAQLLTLTSRKSEIKGMQKTRKAGEHA